MLDEDWFTNAEVDDALYVAQERRKAILIDFWSSTCLGCAKLLKLTWSDETIGKFIRDHFVAIKFKTSEAPERFKLLNGRATHMWHPHIVVADHRLSESRRIIGYMSPPALLGQLQIGLGLLALHSRDYEQAREHFRAAASGAAFAETGAEALYWLGVSEYRIAKTRSALKVVWEDLRNRFPNSQWSERADCLDVEIPESGFDSHDLTTISILDRAPEVSGTGAPPGVGTGQPRDKGLLVGKGGG